MGEKVFISYSHDSAEHSDRVLALADCLREAGVDAVIDRYEPDPQQGWPRWCEEQLRPAVSEFVLVICTATYLARVEGRVPADEGKGVYWEGSILYNYLYNSKLNPRFIPVLIGEEPEDSIPIPLAGFRRYRLRKFDLSDPGFEALYRRLTKQPEVTAGGRGERIILPPKQRLKEKSHLVSTTRSTSAPFDLDRIYAYAPRELIGREAETREIEEAWAKAARGEAHPHVLTFVALGGEGKTSLVAAFANALAARRGADCEAAFAWSFYRQGISEQAGASSDLFFAAALAFFGLAAIERESSYEKGKRLAGAVAAKRALLILDGLEPLQYPPGSPLAGQLKDDGVSALLKALATRNAGLCLVTTRYEIADIRGFAATAPQRELSGLGDAAGAELLASLGVKGPSAELRKLSADMAGHPLTLEILGAYLKRAHGGDVARRDRVDFSRAAAAKGGHAMRAMAAYAQWLASAGEDGARALAMLRLTGLFDRAADAGCLHALWAAPAIAGLTEPLVGLDEEALNCVLSDLEDARLLTCRRDGATLIEIDAHPLLRAYFAKDLREARPKAAREAHGRLYVHLTTTTQDKEAPEIDDLTPLYQAVAHGCAAGLWQEACDEVYNKRIRRDDEDYVVLKLGAYGADLGAVACFFEAPWRRPSPHLTPAAQSFVMSLAGFRLRALGRLAEAGEPMRAGMDIDIAREDWKSAAVASGALSQFELTLGGVAEAVRLGVAAVAHGDLSGDAHQRCVLRATEADARHQAGDAAAAETLFAAAEALRAEEPGQSLRLYAFSGYCYCDLKLGGAETAAWRRLISAPLRASAESLDTLTTLCAEAAERGRGALAIAIRNRWLPQIGLDRLTLARAALYAAVLRGETAPADDVDAAVAAVRRAASQHHLPRALLTRALHRAVAGAFADARADLDEAFEIAERAPMRLHLADIHLHRARLFGLLANRPATYPWTSAQADLQTARKLIESCGYNRRLPELEDAEAALRAL